MNIRNAALLEKMMLLAKASLLDAPKSDFNILLKPSYPSKYIERGQQIREEKQGAEIHVIVDEYPVDTKLIKECETALREEYERKLNLLLAPVVGKPNTEVTAEEINAICREFCCEINVQLSEDFKRPISRNMRIAHDHRLPLPSCLTEFSPCETPEEGEWTLVHEGCLERIYDSPEVATPVEDEP